MTAVAAAMETKVHMKLQTPPFRHGAVFEGVFQRRL
jgi:hypothetical protein